MCNVERVVPTNRTTDYYHLTVQAYRAFTDFELNVLVLWSTTLLCLLGFVLGLVRKLSEGHAAVTSSEKALLDPVYTPCLAPHGRQS